MKDKKGRERGERRKGEVEGITNEITKYKKKQICRKKGGTEIRLQECVKEREREGKEMR